MRFRGPLPSSVLAVLPAVVLAGAFLSARAQSSGMELHATGNVTATDLGLPVYPNAKLTKKDKGDDPAVDLGFTFGDVHFRLVAANYTATASAGQVLDFYRKPLSKYGEVLECDHGKPVGSLKATRSGLTCEDDGGGHIQMGTKSGTGRELRAGTKERFRVVGIDEDAGGSVQFGVVYVELPKDKDKGKD
jgi:hypothetical protein